MWTQPKYTIKYIYLSNRYFQILFNKNTTIGLGELKILLLFCPQFGNSALGDATRRDSVWFLFYFIDVGMFYGSLRYSKNCPTDTERVTIVLSLWIEFARLFLQFITVVHHYNFFIIISLSYVESIQ